MCDAFAHKINPKSKPVLIKHRASNIVATSQKQRVLERQVRELGTIVNRRQTFLRVDQERPNSITADYILFRECLRKNVLPNAAGKLDVPGLTERKRHISGSTQESLLNEKGIASVEAIQSFDDDDELQSPHSIVSYRDDIVAVEHSAVVLLNLSQQGLGPDRGICLSEALIYCPALMIVMLSNNRLHDFSAVRIVNALTTYTACTELDLSENELGILTVSSLADIIEVTTSVWR
jgi:hypothetical protein